MHTRAAWKGKELSLGTLDSFTSAECAEMLRNISIKPMPARTKPGDLFYNYDDELMYWYEDRERCLRAQLELGPRLVEEIRKKALSTC